MFRIHAKFFIKLTIEHQSPSIIYTYGWSSFIATDFRLTPRFAGIVAATAVVASVVLVFALVTVLNDNEACTVFFEAVVSVSSSFRLLAEDSDATAASTAVEARSVLFVTVAVTAAIVVASSSADVPSK